MKQVIEKFLELGAPLRSLKDNLRREQKEMFFNKRNWEEEAEYFNFIKFLFSNPGKI